MEFSSEETWVEEWEADMNDLEVGLDEVASEAVGRELGSIRFAHFF